MFRRIGRPAVHGPLLTAEEFGRRVGIGRVQTVRHPCAAGMVVGASKDRHEWRIDWPAFYAWLAGPSVPEGEIIGSRELARLPDLVGDDARPEVAAAVNQMLSPERGRADMADPRPPWPLTATRDNRRGQRARAQAVSDRRRPLESIAVRCSPPARAGM